MFKWVSTKPGIWEELYEIFNILLATVCLGPHPSLDLWAFYSHNQASGAVLSGPVRSSSKSDCPYLNSQFVIHP